MAMYRAAVLLKQMARGGGGEKWRWMRGVGARAPMVQGVADAHHHINPLPPDSYPLTPHHPRPRAGRARRRRRAEALYATNRPQDGWKGCCRDYYTRGYPTRSYQV